MNLLQRLVGLVLLSLAPLGVVEAYNASALEAERETRARSDAGHIISALRGDEALLFDGMSDVILSVSLDARKVTSDQAACVALISGIAERRSSWLTVSVTDANGIIRCSTDRRLEGTDVGSHPEVVAALKDGKLAVGNIESGPFIQQPIVPLAKVWRQGTTYGVVLATVDLAWIGHAFSADPLPDDTSLVVADRSGRIMAEVPADRSRFGRLLPAGLMHQVTAGAAGTMRGAWVDGSDRIIGYAPVDTQPIGGGFVAVGISRSAALASIHAAARRSQLLFVLTLVLATVFAWWNGHTFVRRPIRALGAAVDRLRHGDLTARTKINGRTELGVLGEAFNQMAQAIQEGERRIDESAKLLSALIDATPDSVYVKDACGRIMITNAAYARLNGLDRGDCVGKLDTEVAPVGIRTRIADMRQRVVVSGDVQTIEIEYPDGHGGVKCFQTVYMPVLGENHVTHVAGIGREVTNLRAVAEELRAAKERAEEADRSKTRFLAAASHDLRQPLQGALLFADVALAQIPRSSAHDALSKVSLALVDLQNLLDSLMDVSRMDIGAIEPKISDFSIGTVVEQISASYRSAAESKGLRLVAVDSDTIVRSDPILLGRMLRNIVENAVRYTERGRVLIDCIPSGNYLRVEVHDTGPGIAPDDMERIWEEFQQLHHNPERDRKQGVGLGLSIVRRLSEILGHRTTVTSKEGHGSLFALEVPIVAWPVKPECPAPLTIEHVAPPRGNTSDHRIALIIDDDPHIRNALSLILSLSGFHVLAAAGGSEAIDLADKNGAPDFVIADFRLRGGETGADAITRLREATGRYIGGVILTGEIQPEPAAFAARLGLGLLLKPVTSSQLFKALKEACPNVMMSYFADQHSQCLEPDEV
jgi:PAS domain S-box-containing protein